MSTEQLESAYKYFDAQYRAENARVDYPPSNREAFLAGAEWMRERCKEIAVQQEWSMDSALKGGTPMVEHYQGASVASSEIARRIREL